MPRTRDANIAIKDERKSEIIEASIFLFACFGNKVSIDQISERAKCSHGLVYHYFLDTNHILRTIKKDERYVSLFNKIITTKNERPIDQIFEIISNVNSILTKKDNIALSMLAIMNRDELKNHLITLVKNGQKDGTINPGKPEEIVQIYINQNSGVLMEILLQKSTKIIIPHPDNIFQIFYKKTVR